MKYIYGLCIWLGLFLAIGFAGGCDCGAITFGQTVWYSIGSILIMIVGLAGSKSLEEG